MKNLRCPKCGGRAIFTTAVTWMMTPASKVYCGWCPWRGTAGECES